MGGEKVPSLSVWKVNLICTLTLKLSCMRLAKLEPDLSKRLGRFFTMLMGYSVPHLPLIKSERNCSDALSRLPTVANPETGELEFVEEDLVCEREAENAMSMRPQK